MEHSEDIEAGIYMYNEEERGAASATSEQKRAEIMECLKTSKCFTASILDEDRGGVLHSTFIIDLDALGEDAHTFLVYAALQLIRDLSHLFGFDMDKTFAMLKHVQNGWDEEDGKEMTCQGPGQ